MGNLWDENDPYGRGAEPFGTAEFAESWVPEWTRPTLPIVAGSQTVEQTLEIDVAVLTGKTLVHVQRCAAEQAAVRDLLRYELAGRAGGLPSRN